MDGSKRLSDWIGRWNSAGIRITWQVSSSSWSGPNPADPLISWSIQPAGRDSRPLWIDPYRLLEILEDSWRWLNLLFPPLPPPQSTEVARSHWRRSSLKDRSWLVAYCIEDHCFIPAPIVDHFCAQFHTRQFVAQTKWESRWWRRRRRRRWWKRESMTCQTAF